MSTEQAPAYLPAELIHEVLLCAWYGMPSRDRWEMFRALSLVSWAWQSDILSVVTRNVILRDQSDVRAYSTLLSNCNDSSGRVISGISAEATALSRATFIAIAQDSSNRDLIKRLHPVLRLLPSTRTLHDFAHHSPLEMIELPSIGHLLQSVTTLTLSGSLGYTPTVQRKGTPWFPSLTYLHLNFIPANRTRHLQNILQWFPTVTNLRISSYCYLKEAALISQKCLSLELDCPPIPFGHGHITDLRPFTLALALKAGLMAPARGKKIIVYTGRDTPNGWERAIESCKEYGVVLKRKVVYPKMPAGIYEVFGALGAPGMS